MTTTQEPPKSAVILTFPRKRGRPRKNLPARDTGTIELARKRSLGETAEALDLCLSNGLISNTQHWCGMHLRWLHTLRYGAPGVRAIDPAHLGGTEIKQDDPEWRAEREREYNEAVNRLHRSGHADIVSGICIYNEKPDFLKKPASITRRHANSVSRQSQKLIEGLEILSGLWSRPITKN